MQQKWKKHFSTISEIRREQAENVKQNTIYPSVNAGDALFSCKFNALPLGETSSKTGVAHPPSHALKKSESWSPKVNKHLPGEMMCLGGANWEQKRGEIIKEEHVCVWVCLLVRRKSVFIGETAHAPEHTRHVSPQLGQRGVRKNFVRDLEGMRKDTS